MICSKDEILEINNFLKKFSPHKILANQNFANLFNGKLKWYNFWKLKQYNYNLGPEKNRFWPVQGPAW